MQLFPCHRLCSSTFIAHWPQSNVSRISFSFASAIVRHAAPAIVPTTSVAAFPTSTILVHHDLSEHLILFFECSPHCHPHLCPDQDNTHANVQFCPANSPPPARSFDLHWFSQLTAIFSYSNAFSTCLFFTFLIVWLFHLIIVITTIIVSSLPRPTLFPQKPSEPFTSSCVRIILPLLLLCSFKKTNTDFYLIFWILSRPIRCWCVTILLYFYFAQHSDMSKLLFSVAITELSFFMKFSMQ